MTLGNTSLLLAEEVALELRIEIGKKRACDLYKLFDRWKIPYLRLGNTRRYRKIDVEKFIHGNIEEPKRCQLKKGKIHHSTGMTSQSKVVGFAEAVKLTKSKQQKH